MDLDLKITARSQTWFGSENSANKFLEELSQNKKINPKYYEYLEAIDSNIIEEIATSNAKYFDESFLFYEYINSANKWNVE